MATAASAELLYLSSSRNPYPGKPAFSKRVRSPIYCWSTAIRSMTSRLLPNRSETLIIIIKEG